MPRYAPDKIPKKWRKILLNIPGYDSIATAGDCVFDDGAAQKVIDFFEEACTHTQGSLAGEPLILEPWQQAIVANLFGWKRPDGWRRYRECLLFVPRKNGKSTFGAGLALDMLVGDGEQGAQVYSSASDAKQAALVFDIARVMVQNKPELGKYLVKYRESLVFHARNSAYKVLSAEAGTKHGFNTHCAINDEIHAHPNRELIDVLATGMGSRDQPLTMHLTTSDYEREGSVCNEKHRYASRVRDGSKMPPGPSRFEDQAFLPVIYEATKDDDWLAEETLEKANPNIDVSVSREYLHRERKRAQEDPSFENTFKRLHLNIRTEQAERVIQMHLWDACNGKVDLEAFKQRPCHGGLDLATVTDATCLVLASFDGDGVLEVVPYVWIPEEKAELRERKEGVPFTQWHRDGWIQPTPKDQIDYEEIRRTITGGQLHDYERAEGSILDEFQLGELAVETGFQGYQLANQIEGDGLEVVTLYMGFRDMAPAMKRLLELLKQGKIRHGGHPVLRWMASNLAAKKSQDGSKMMPCKKASTNQIDGMVSLIMALARAMVHGDETSVYDRRAPVMI